MLVDETIALARAAGLEAVEARPKPEYVAAFEEAGDALYERVRAALPRGRRVAEYVTSVEITARRRE